MGSNNASVNIQPFQKILDVITKSQQQCIFFLLLNVLYILQSVAIHCVCVRMHTCILGGFQTNEGSLNSEFLRRVSQSLLILKISTAQQESLFYTVSSPLGCCCHLPQVMPAPVNYVLLFPLENEPEPLSCLKQRPIPCWSLFHKPCQQIELASFVSPSLALQGKLYS